MGNSFHPSNAANGPDYEDIDWEHSQQLANPNWVRPTAVTYDYPLEEVPTELLEQIVERCIVEITCPACGNTCFYFLPWRGHQDKFCQVDGCDTRFEIA